jgi:hypothetical protein
LNDTLDDAAFRQRICDSAALLGRLAGELQQRAQAAGAAPSPTLAATLAAMGSSRPPQKTTLHRWP